MSAQMFDIGDRVVWAWGDGHGEGRIEARYTQSVTKTIKGTEVTRHAAPDQPAYLICQEDGAKVLKSCTELSAA